MRTTFIEFNRANPETGESAGTIFVASDQIESFESVPLSGPIIIGERRPSVVVLQLKAGRRVAVRDSLGDIIAAVSESR